MEERELVVLVDEQNNPIGTREKREVHSLDTPLHRGFSVFLFNSRRELLLQQRSRQKITWPLVWSNSCCGHPAPGEEPIDAARRRLWYELGLREVALSVALPEYRYRAVFKGVCENEFCPVLVGVSDELPQPNPLEVTSVVWISWIAFKQRLSSEPDRFSVWCREEASLLEAHPSFNSFITGASAQLL